MHKILSLTLSSILFAACTSMRAGKELAADVGTDAPDSIEMAVSMTFQKEDAELAMNFYVELFEDARIVSIHRWGPEGPGKEGNIMMATFELNGMRFICSDSPPIHNWDFSPAVAIYVNCRSEEAVKRIYSGLSKDGMAAMPLANYGFSSLFGWVIDQFGVSWQLNLP